MEETLSFMKTRLGSNVKYNSSLTSRLPDRYIIMSVDSLHVDTTVPYGFWKEKELEFIYHGLRVIFIGKKSSNLVDQGNTTSEMKYVPEVESIDLRNKTSIEDVFSIILNSMFVCTVCNSIAVIAYELKKTCYTYGVMGDNEHVYHKRFFIDPYPSFNLMDIEDTRRWRSE